MVRKTSQKITTRPLRKDELATMVALWRGSGLPTRPRGRDRMTSLVKQHKADPEQFLGAFAGKKLVGVALITHDGRKGWINRLAVSPDSRRMGVATELIEASEDILRKRGFRLFCVLIESYNKESMILFERRGYRKEDDIFYYTKRELESY